MLKKIVFFYGPKYNFRRRLPRNKPLTTISELAIYSDKKMREHTFKIQGKRGGDAAEKQEERLAVPCLVAYSEQYASISESALHSFLSFIDQFEVESLYLQNPPAHLAAQFRNMHSRVKVIKHEYKTLNFESLKRIDREYQLAIIGQEEVKRRLLTALYPLAAKKLSKPLVLLFFVLQPGLSTLHDGYLTCLFFDRHILMDNTDTTFTCNGNCHFRFGNRIHSGRYKRNFQLNVFRKLCREFDSFRKHFRVSGD